MNSLPIPADSLDYLHAKQLAPNYQALTENELIHLKSLLPKWAEWMEGVKQRAGLPADQQKNISMADVNGLFPYAASYYATPTGWLVTTRRAIVENPKVPGIQPRDLDPAACWQGATPAAALLAMMTERINTKEMRYGEMGQMVVLGQAAYA